MFCYVVFLTRCGMQLLLYLFSEFTVVCHMTYNKEKKKKN